ncbi:MAG: RlmE family RNA methyltransferase [Treponema sp.]|jgi:23S rRNA (uridine2552-2'-O)-methyltransferase|nr:RlmE family RNA methyltransferase [Treponema sp.]
MANYEKPDHWTVKAKSEGYPARSVYKLKEADEKFSLVKAGQAVRILDLGAAPGSWSLYVLRKLALRFQNGGAFLAAADLAPLSTEYGKGLFESEHFFFVQGDITNPGVRSALLDQGPYDLVMSDAAPATTGNRSVDVMRSRELAETAADYALSSLRPGGNFIVKIFQGSDAHLLLKKIRECFSAGKSFKPAACRSESFETYYIGLGKKREDRFTNANTTRAQGL